MLDVQTIRTEVVDLGQIGWRYCLIGVVSEELVGQYNQNAEDI
jgi:hypothetical protein